MLLLNYFILLLLMKACLSSQEKKKLAHPRHAVHNFQVLIKALKATNRIPRVHNPRPSAQRVSLYRMFLLEWLMCHPLWQESEAQPPSCQSSFKHCRVISDFQLTKISGFISRLHMLLFSVVKENDTLYFSCPGQFISDKYFCVSSTLQSCSMCCKSPVMVYKPCTLQQYRAAPFHKEPNAEKPRDCWSLSKTQTLVLAPFLLG